ncbi:MAG: hypothetical protein HYY78_02460 [Betaproteobacteria bacterium]|nr:hypothetical protein [Betaproteobacteria bacterium]
MSTNAFQFIQRSALLFVCSAILGAVPRPALSSGAFVHLAAAEKARSEVKKSVKDNLTGPYVAWYYAGVAFPDAMLQVNRSTGSWAHFGSFLQNAAQQMSENCPSVGAKYAGDVTCKELIAFYLGVLSHVMVDYRFDSNFVRRTKNSCPAFKDYTLSGDVQEWTDEVLDAVAACKQRGYFSDTIFGKDRKFVVRYPTGFISDVARVTKRALTEKQIRDGYRKWLDATIKGERDLVSAGVFCETALATGVGMPFSKKISGNPWNKCEWATKESNYWKNKKVSGSVADMAKDFLPPLLEATYDRLVASFGKKADWPTFYHNKKSWPDERLCLAWTRVSSQNCPK